ncbi:ParB/Srx family N-terminal domain-containing protein [Paenarthrobacter nicotinovorans]|uniref:ParB/Srx family N-terminal domain-containing protein n=1 Tax=Paenarthrobacter nicotinovorans TaxID=29320 RepID=A0ABV0GMN4_PAENI
MQNKIAELGASVPDFAYVDVNKLHFDPHNPRFPRSVDGENSVAVLDFMLDDANLIDLMRSIATQGFFPGEPLLVSPHDANEGEWVVIEGNRRLAAAKLLLQPDLAPTRIQAVRTVVENSDSLPERLPCLQFNNRGDILQHLGYRHVTGIKEWDPLAKARYLQQRYESLTGDQAHRFRYLARSIGSRSDYVGRLLTALMIYENIENRNYFDIDNLSEGTLEFSLITSVLAYENIVQYLGLSSAQSAKVSELDVDALRWLVIWVFQKKTGKRTILGESRNIKLLAEAVSHPRSLAALRGGQPLSVAAKLSGAASESFRLAIISAKENVSLARDYASDLEEVEPVDIGLVDELFQEVKGLRSALRDLADGDD